MTEHTQDGPAIETLVDAMISSCGQLQVIIGHMRRHRNPDGPPIPVVLRQLLGSVLVTLNERHGNADVATTAQMLAAASDLIAEEIYLVEPPE